MYYDYETKTLDLTSVKMSQNANILVRNERAKEYSEMCRERKNAKFETIVDIIMNIIIVLTSCFITFCLMTVS